MLNGKCNVNHCLDPINEYSVTKNKQNLHVIIAVIVLSLHIIKISEIKKIYRQ